VILPLWVWISDMSVFPGIYLSDSAPLTISLSSFVM
jgi:hypothetical protein